MQVTKVLNPARGDVQRKRHAIRSSWSRLQRDKRRRIAASRQEWLFSALFPQGATVPARVA